MTRLHISNCEVFLVASFIGLIATFSAPWLELRGTFQAWRIVEWHTFWRGDAAFMLADVVSANFSPPIEFATGGMRDTVRLVSTAGVMLAVWHTGAFLALVGLGAIARTGRGIPERRSLLEGIIILLAAVIVLYALAQVFALPSALSGKVDFRTPADIHSDSLVWSSVAVFPVAPMLSLGATVIQVIVLFSSVRNRRRPRSLVGGPSL